MLLLWSNWADVFFSLLLTEHGWLDCGPEEEQRGLIDGEGCSAERRATRCMSGPNTLFDTQSCTVHRLTTSGLWRPPDGPPLIPLLSLSLSLHRLSTGPRCSACCGNIHHLLRFLDASSSAPKINLNRLDHTHVWGDKEASCPADIAAPSSILLQRAMKQQ